MIYSIAFESPDKGVIVAKEQSSTFMHFMFSQIYHVNLGRYTYQFKIQIGKHCRKMRILSFMLY